MAMGRRKRDRQVAMWITTTELPTAASHPFYRRLNQLLREHGFDNFAEAQCGRSLAIQRDHLARSPDSSLRRRSRDKRHLNHGLRATARIWDRANSSRPFASVRKQCA